MSEACPYCDAPMTISTRDHIVPRTMGNRGPQNIIKVCRACNQLKGNMTPDAMRTFAEEMEFEAGVVRAMADRVERLISDRGLLSGAESAPTGARAEMEGE